MKFYKGIKWVLHWSIEEFYKGILFFTPKEIDKKIDVFVQADFRVLRLNQDFRDPQKPDFNRWAIH